MEKVIKSYQKLSWKYHRDVENIVRYQKASNGTVRMTFNQSWLKINIRSTCVHPFVEVKGTFRIDLLKFKTMFEKQIRGTTLKQHASYVWSISICSRPIQQVHFVCLYIYYMQYITIDLTLNRRVTKRNPLRLCVNAQYRRLQPSSTGDYW